VDYAKRFQMPDDEGPPRPAPSAAPKAEVPEPEPEPPRVPRRDLVFGLVNFLATSDHELAPRAIVLQFELTQLLADFFRGTISDMVEGGR
jgi:hypothetical protein